jgi:formylglycine-generating enzyme required for sulfatase activity
MGLIPLGPDPDSTFEEFAVADSGEIPVRDPATRKLVLTDGFAVVLVLLPGGTVGMGAQAADMSEPNFDPDARAHEGPVRDVTLPAFFISKYEMTRAQWLSVNLADPSIFLTGTAPVRQAITPRNPVENASWTENARTATRLGLRLPTEVEWEYACRAGTMTVFFTGDAVDTLKGYANVADEGSEPFYARGFPFVPGFVPNAFGLHDMHGNVTEWMEDACKEPDAQSPTMDPRLGAPRPMRSIRGGAFGDHFTKLRVANRSCHVPTFRSGSVGLRVARNVDS